MIIVNNGILPQNFNKMEERLKIKEAFARSEMRGKKVFKKDVSNRLFPNQPKSTQQVKFTNLVNGTTKRITATQVRILCEMLDCDANFLFGL